MSLRRTTLVYFILATLGLLGVSLISLNRILKPHFLKQQEAELSINLQRVEKSIEQRLETLATFSADWVQNPEVLTGSKTQSREAAARLILPSIVDQLNISFVTLVDSHGQIVWVLHYAMPISADQSLPVEVTSHFQPGDPLISGETETSVKTGLLEIGGVPYLLSSHPAIDPAQSGRRLGTLVVGSQLDQNAIEQLNNLLQLGVSIFPLDQTAAQPELAVAVQQLQARAGPYILLSDDLVSGYDLLEDFYSTPAFLVRIDQYPGIFKNGELVFNYLILAQIMSGITFITLLFLLIEGNVLSRLRQLSQEVLAVGRSGDINRRLRVQRKDELGQLGGAINDMLADLQQAVILREQSEERFQKLVESMDDVVFSIDRETEKVQVYGKNAAKSDLLTAGTLTEKLNLLISELGNQIESHRELLEKTYSGENTGLEWSAYENGRERNYYATLSPMHNPLGETTTIVGVSRDISSIKKMEYELRRRADEFGALFETSQALLSQMDIDATQDVICRLAVQKMGLDAAWIGRVSSDGSSLEPAASSDVAAIDQLNLPLYIDGAPNQHPAVQAFVNHDVRVDNRVLLHRPGSEDTLIPVSLASIPLTQGSAVLAVLTLIKRKPDFYNDDHLQLLKAFANLSGLALQNTYLFKQVLNGRSRLQAVSRRLVEIQEEERRTIALELHDEIGQILTGLRLSVDMINTLPQEQIAAQTRSVIEIIHDLISRVRQMSLDLRPSMLDDLGIVPTILWHIDRYTTQTGIQVNLHQTNVQNRRFRSEIETTIYRVVQEGLTNIARYADVKSANVRLWCTDKILGVQIEDEGRGFDPDEVFSAHKSRGLLGMRERLGFIGGQLLVVSQPGQGTSLTIEIPLEGRLERRQHDR